MSYFLFIVLLYIYVHSIYLYVVLSKYFCKLCISRYFLTSKWGGVYIKGELHSTRDNLFDIYKRGRSNINSYVKTCFYTNLWFNEFRFCNHQKGGDCWYKNAIYISQYLFVLTITKRKNIKRKVNTKTSY